MGGETTGRNPTDRVKQGVKRSILTDGRGVVRAGALGLPMALAIIGGMPERFAPLAQLYREAARRAGHDPSRLPLSINSHGFIADQAQQAVDAYYPSAVVVMNKIGRERGWPPAPRSSSKHHGCCAGPILWAARLKSLRRFYSSTKSLVISGCCCNWASERLSTPKSCTRLNCLARRLRPWSARKLRGLMLRPLTVRAVRDDSLTLSRFLIRA